MTTLFRPTVDGVNTPEGGLLTVDGDPYAPALVDGKYHPEVQAHIDAVRLVPVDEREVDERGLIADEPTAEPDVKALPAAKPKPAARGKQEA